MVAPNPIAFTIFGIDIMWYGILIGIGFLLAITISYKRAPLHGIESEHILDLSIWIIPSAIIGARLYYVIFSWSSYNGNLKAMLNIRGGGLAIHGGIIACVIVAYFVCKHYKMDLIEVFDLMFPAVALAQSIGRWGNFFNSEAHGGPTTLPWGVLVDGQYVHPTFLYESVWCFLLFWFLLYVDKRRKFKGQIVCLYGILYSTERFFVEQLRTDSLMIGSFRQAQVISFVIFAVCLLIYIILYRKQKRRI